MVLLTIIFLLIAVIFPVLDYMWEKRMQKYPETRNKMKTYIVIIIIQWSLTLLILGLFKVKEMSFTELGFVSEFGEAGNFLLFVAGLLTSMILLILVLIALPFTRKNIISQFEAIESLLPVGPKERIVFTFVAITAGFCEEVMYRGFMFHYFESLSFGLSPIMIALITSIIFGLIHAYQGWKGMLITGLIGFALARMYIAYDSLWIPIILHIIIDLRFAVMPNLAAIFRNKKG